ncbi:MAG: precorrin-6A reductase [Oscillospiraceae bacterium]|nr:precorrin-6A reductase [Oscillospiraceae bacterium]
MNILIFGGTAEGRALARRLCSNHRVAVSVATPLGAEELRDLPQVQVLCGRLDAEGMARILKGFDWCIDATHPYAQQVSRELRSACARTGVPLRRLLRAASRTEGCVRLPDCRRAAEFLAGQQGNVLAATGAKELSAFSPLPVERLYVRVLPTHEALTACEALGLPHAHIIAMQGPFSQKLNEALLEQYRIRWLVSKDGGAAGGFEEKQAAAAQAGAALVLVERPRDAGASMEEILKELEGLE